MADAKISQLPVATTPLAGTELVPIVQTATTKQTTVDAVIAAAAASSTVVSSSDIGTAPNEIPLNQYLGSLAYQDGDNIAGNVRVGGDFTVDGTVNFGGVSSDIVNVDEFVAATSAVMRGGSTNLLTYSEQFDNAAWTKTNATITTNTVIAPDGTLTGDLLVADATSNEHFAFQSPTLTSASYTATIYAKAGGYNFLRFREAHFARSAYFDLSSGTTGTVDSGLTTSITYVGNGWYRCAVTFTASATALSLRFQVAAANGSPTFTGDGTSGIYLWGAQLNVGSTASPYLKTVADAVSTAYAAPVESPNGLAVPLLASMTPARRSDMTFELASNTSLVIKVKGTDGTVRSVALTLA